MTKKTVILAFLVVVGIAIVFLVNPFQSTPKEIIKEMNIKMAGLETVHSKVTADIKMELEEDPFDLSLVFNNDLDNTNSESIRSGGDFDITLEIEGMQFSLRGEDIITKDASYIKLTTIPALPMIDPIFQMMGIDLSTLKNQWIKLEEDSVKNLMGEQASSVEIEKKQQAEVIKKLQELLITRDFYSVTQELPEEKISDQTVYHYIVSLEKEETKSLILDMAGIISGSQNGSFSLSPEELDKFSQDFDESFTQAGGIEADLWIGKQDKYLYKFELNKDIDVTDGKGVVVGIADIHLIMEFSNFDQPVSIITPENSKSLDELFNSFMMMPDPTGMYFE